MYIYLALQTYIQIVRQCVQKTPLPIVGLGRRGRVKGPYAR